MTTQRVNGALARGRSRRAGGGEPRNERGLRVSGLASQRQVDAGGSGSDASSPRSSLAAYCLPSSASTARSARVQGTEGGGGGGDGHGQPLSAGARSSIGEALAPPTVESSAAQRPQPASAQARNSRSQMLPKDPLPMRRPSRYLLGYVEEDEAAQRRGEERQHASSLARQRLWTRPRQAGRRAPSSLQRQGARLAQPHACSPILPGVPHLACGVSDQSAGHRTFFLGRVACESDFDGESDSALVP